MRYVSTKAGAHDDLRRVFAMAIGGAALFAPVEYVLSLVVYRGPLGFLAKLRFVALDVTLAILLAFGIALVGAAVVVGSRLVEAALHGPARGRRRGWFDPTPVEHGIRTGVPLVWAAVATGGLLGFGLQRVAARAVIQYKEPQLTAILIAIAALGACAVAPSLYRGLATGTVAAARGLAPLFGRANPLGRWRAMGVALAGTIGGVMIATWFVLPQSRSVLPVRLVISAIAIALGMGLGAQYAARRRPRLLGVAGARLVAAGTAAFVTLTLAWLGADLETRYIVTPQTALDKLIDIVRVANDVDRDTFGSLLGENDCGPFDRRIYPDAPDAPDDGIDQNCDGHDYSMKAIVVPKGSGMPIPKQFARDDWNFLFLTIDTVRYDRTTFGGYAQGPKKRDTTPELAKLVGKSVSFSFAQAPSAGTMASIPAILTSKFFHSGIALDEKMPPGSPPKLMPENVLLPEIMKRAGYYTGVIASHEYWNNWGMEQGVDEYDNSIGKTSDPFRVAADKVTNQIVAWVSRQQGRKWFLWAHYIDPHGRYVAHPDIADWGNAEPDLYDAELKWTDQEIGRLLKELVRLPSASRTIIVITSDHGDSMAEHNVPLGTHGTALYREMLHVPLIFYIPENTARTVGGAVSNLDVVPTVAELAGIDVHDLQFEGRSLVPQIFYGKDDPERIVFAETNAPTKQRAAISAQWKLIFYITSNLVELYDLVKDPWEKDNLATKMKPTEGAYAKMKAELDAWLERVVFQRDPKFNQAYRAVADVVLTKPPTPPMPTTGQTIGDGGAIELLGIGIADNKAAAPKMKVDIQVYMHATGKLAKPYKFQLIVWPLADDAKPEDGVGKDALRTALRVTVDGLYPSTRWTEGEYIRERFPVTIPDWTAKRIAVALVANDGGWARPTGATPAGEQTAAILGVLPLRQPAGRPDTPRP